MWVFENTSFLTLFSNPFSLNLFFINIIGKTFAQRCYLKFVFQGPPASWEELLEPGHIEHHLGRLNLHDRTHNGRHDVPIPPVPAPMPPLHVLSRVPPPPLNVPVPVRMHPQYLNNYGRVRVTPPVVLSRPPPPMIDTR